MIKFHVYLYPEPIEHDVKLQPISVREQPELNLSPRWRVSLTMATDEADAALNHQRNGFSRVLKHTERGEQELLPQKEEDKTEDWCGNTTHRHTCSLPGGFPHTCLHKHMHRCTHLRVCEGGRGGGGGWAQYPAVARRRRLLLFPLFVWGFQKSLGSTG